MNFCECRKRRGKWSDKCKSCLEKEMVERNRRQVEFINRVNEAIGKGAEIHTRVLDRLVTIAYLYAGVPGTWFVDNNGNHWCGAPYNDIEKVLNISK